MAIDCVVRLVKICYVMIVLINISIELLKRCCEVVIEFTLYVVIPVWFSGNC